MAYVNVAEWKADQVCEWLKGLDSTVLPYIHSFLNHDVNGQQLLNLQSQDLEELGVIKLGHQEIILEAVECLKGFHYDLDKENLQLLALRLSSQAHSLHKELCRQRDSESVTTQTLSDVASIMMAVKPLVRWMDYPPFSGHIEYHTKKIELMKISIEMATCAQRDRFAENPVYDIRTTCRQLATLADYIVQEIVDPLILQPASLDLATLKKKSSDDLGFTILPSFHGIHQITEIKLGSAAHLSGKMTEGDEIVQINYQTVVGWERKNLLELFRESPAEMLLTIKRRPRHTKIFGQIYIKPYKLPSNKNTSFAKQGRKLSSPRPELLTIPDFAMPSPRHMPRGSDGEPTSILDAVKMLDIMTTDSSDSDSESESQLYAKPRSLVQRRATITGASPTSKYGINLERFWKEFKREHNAAVQLRDKAASCAHGLDNVPMVNIRPQTCLGLESARKKSKTSNEQTNKKVQFEEKLINTESARPDDIKETVTVIARNCDDGANMINRDTNIEDLRASTDNVNDSNNLNDTTVPLDEHNSVSDTGSINKSILSDKEIGTRHIKKLSKSDENPSISAYNLSDTVEKLDLLDYISNKNLKKTDACTVDCKKFKDASSECKETPAERCDVAQKISNIEKQIARENVREQASAFEVFKSIDDALNNLSFENSTNEENQNDPKRNKCAVECDIIVNEHFKTVHLKNSTCKCHGNADKIKCSNSNNSSSSTNGTSTSSNSSSNSNNSSDRNINGNSDNSSNSCSNSCSNSNSSSNSSINERDETSQKLEKILQTIDCSTLICAELENKFSSVLSRENLLPNNNTRSIEDDLSSVYNVSAKTIKEEKSADSSSTQVTVQSHCCIELSKIEFIKRFNNKPPEPPPRKYYMDQAISDSKLNNALRAPKDSHKPQVPERSGLKRDCKQVDLSSNHVKSNSDCQDRRNFSDVRTLIYTENSTNFIGEPRALSLSDQTFDRLNFSNALLYNESNDKQSREEKCSFEKYEPFVEKFVCSDQSITDCYRFDYSRNVDCPDGITHTKQTAPSDLKQRLSEKDKNIEKSVVNRAMMVAKSIGLHSSLNKSNSSPRSNRKRNMLLAKGRNVSVKDICTGDLEGWLTYRSRGAGGAWAKAWFVLKCSSLYRFKTQDSVKADCLIILTGFTVSPADEVKSRKYSFKVYHTGTVFYFAADTEDSLMLWLDTVSKGTLGADAQNQSVGLFSETDESDSESHKSKPKCPPESSKLNPEKSFGSLKKSVRKDVGLFKEIGGASLDRKYLKFLSARNQNIPVPTAQFRSYRRVVPTLTSNKSVDRRFDNSQSFFTQEDFMTSQQNAEHQQSTINRSMVPHVMPLLGDHIHVEHRNLNDDMAYSAQIRQLNTDAFSLDGNIYGKIGDEVPNNNVVCIYSRNTNAHLHAPSQSVKDNTITLRSDSETSRANDNKSYGRCMTIGQKRIWDSSSYAQKKRVQEFVSTQKSRHDDSFCWKEFSGSSCDLVSHAVPKTQQCVIRDVSISRKESFNLNRNDYNLFSDKNWVNSLRHDKKGLSCVKNQLKNVAQYQPPPIPTSSFEQEGMRAAFEMHLDKNDQKTSRLKVLFGTKQQKPSTLDLSKNTESTVLEASSPPLRRALFCDKYCSNQLQSQLSTSSGSPSPGDSGIGQSQNSFNNSPCEMFAQAFGSIGSVNNLNSEITTSSDVSKYDGYSSSHKEILNSGRNLAPPTLPYIPPPTSPPPDYSGLEYPPVFEPETYSLSDASLLRNRNKNSQNTSQ
ncbi:uncharacterized protein LOC105839284 isoform X2 [Monomorium pharaonis]|uniref:uncharacterized protein LOC105839284 isoform X2 n=1 Tax=Monomorium pharaonis TaxID=307658 RepID=UPI001746F452|nr:uncharacterized protein LOC105839284 isoform X2 [Monomorium pharaonis]